MISRINKSKKCRARSWVEASFQKRDCVNFIPSKLDKNRCSCGLSLTFHCGGGNGSIQLDPNSSNEAWSPLKHTILSPTDAYGTIEFQGGPHPTKAQYVRLSHDTRPELILHLFTREWGLELPKLLITIQGGKANFELQPKLKKVLRKGLLKAAKTTGAWVFTGGTNTGVTRQVGDALLLDSQRTGRIVSIGIAPWGIIENNHELIGHNKDVPYHSISSPRSKLAVLNNRHTYFLLVDNGTSARYGAEIVLRRKLEKYISIQKLHPSAHYSTPVVCLVIEGGTNTIRAVLEYVTDTPPVPVVVCDGSGRAADLIAFTHKYASDTGEQTVLENMKEYILDNIRRAFEIGQEQAECLYQELLECTKYKNMITVFRISDGQEKSQELDQTILTALFKSQHLSPSEQLSLALTWNRVDIARSEIFVYGQEWPPGALEESMMQALEHDRIDFVKLLLENGVSMKKFLTISRLEELYNTKQGPTNTLGYILRDVRPHIPQGYMYTLHDIGLVINKLMGGAYRTQYTRRKFRMMYAQTRRLNNMHRNSASFTRYYGNNLTLGVLADSENSEDETLFEYPFNELLIWTVLTKRQEMALLMWQHGEEALVKSLAACKLYKAMAHEAAEDDLETEIYDELRNYAKVFEDIALELLDYCYRQDDDQAQQLLTVELQNWSGQTCLSLAVAANHRALLAHPCSQIILADLWMGGLRTRKNTNIRILLGLLFPPYISRLEFKSREELQSMPQTEEEHLYGLELDEETESMEEGGIHRSQLNLVETNLDGGVVPGDGDNAEHGTMLPSGSLGTTKSLDFEHKCASPPYEYSVFDLKRQRPLPLRRKIFEFYTAPITKFLANSAAYFIFLVLFTYVVLVRMEPDPSWQELYVIAYICTFGCEKIREIVSSEPTSISDKFSVWAWNMWNPCDAAAIIFFLIGLCLRLKQSSQSIGRVMFCVDIIYWYLRILNILGVNKYLGPLVTMMGKMVKNMLYFVVLLLVVLMSFGVSRQSILHPDSDPDWILIRHIFLQPYFMLYGEVYADEIYPECDDTQGMQHCETGRWITPLVMAMYLLIANILLINLLIAVFNNIFNDINAISHQVWMFQRFTVVMEYEQKPALPPPLIFFCHVFLLTKYLCRKIQGIQETYDNGLKLFLCNEELEQLYDFEEECVEGYFREKDYKVQVSMEERIKMSLDKMENIQQKVEDINQKENSHNSSVQSLEFRLHKIEELMDQTLSTLSVIHRFMATQSGDHESGSSSDNAHKRNNMYEPEFENEPKILPTVGRTRCISERSDLLSDISDNLLPSTCHRRKKFSFTEVRHSNLSDSNFLLSLDGVSSYHDRPCMELNSYDCRRMSAHSAKTLDRKYDTESTLSPDLNNKDIDDLSNTDNIDNITEENKVGEVSKAKSCVGSAWIEPRIKVFAPPSSRPVMINKRIEYTSITDELETVCGLISPTCSPSMLSPHCDHSPIRGNTPVSRKRHASEMSNPEIARYLEKEHLRDAEENDYHLMEDLIRHHKQNTSNSIDIPNIIQHDYVTVYKSLSTQPSTLDAETSELPLTVAQTSECSTSINPLNSLSSTKQD
ncbi:transient receptor potential cation channel trpm isoform X1 [Daktulosphaira vitifoliae]|uniref:transient receptor potential cation channel trpm isoform X1 n=1 Tax=Daktulosphaira vitifoliae TaxID=58002 RepID=UPI0021A987E1|nr:transient receptor potential cation channel trpm isoform X1 [Daktulosphaira vitifoliae]XP_050524713.1 transient receptor potential cation channel trpm isoform X1 [Daktulosphaira vitifoliae]XP_050524721.1 transient receptor potential cation channel trpm isoform X1 [Daktulosphaira vitifoliae]